MATSQNPLTFYDYEGFVAKFKHNKNKKTTDDCYTPQPVYEEVLRFVGELTDLKGREIVRPFFPGGDYEHYDYPENCIVVDNPPFSIYAQIVRFYLARGIDFFLFAPALTQFVSNANACHIVCMSEITYENGAVVPTSFTTSLLPDTRVWVCGSLAKRIEAVQVKKTKKAQKTLYPDNVITASTMGKIAARGVDFKVRADQCCFIRRTDNLPKNKHLFGVGFLLSDSAAAERAAAEGAAAERAAAEWAASERAAAERAAAFIIQLSDREKDIIDSLNRGEMQKKGNRAIKPQ